MLLPPKPVLHAACWAHAQLRPAAARAGMVAAQESFNSETKSSVGGECETSRAMAQQERDRHAVGPRGRTSFLLSSVERA